MSSKDKIYLSASRIKTYNDCSWLYWCKYHLKLPDPSNDGAKMGDICHRVFDVLSNSKHRAHYDKIVRHNDVFSSPAMARMIGTLARKAKVTEDSHYSLINKMILEGLKYDFWGKTHGNVVSQETEKEFNIEEDSPTNRYNIRGYIDRLFVYDSGLILIRDFKSSKKVFSGEDLNFNTQSFMYVLAAKKLFPNHNPRTQFLFLQFLPDDGDFLMPFISDDELNGFQSWLSIIQKQLEGFNDKTAVTNFAYDQSYPSDGSFGGPRKCGFAKQKGQLKKDGSKMWHCPYKFSFYYYLVHSPDGDFLGSAEEDSFDRSLWPEGSIFTKKYYSGCPLHLTKKA